MSVVAEIGGVSGIWIAGIWIELFPVAITFAFPVFTAAAAGMEMLMILFSLSLCIDSLVRYVLIMGDLELDKPDRIVVTGKCLITKGKGFNTSRRGAAALLLRHLFYKIASYLPR